MTYGNPFGRPDFGNVFTPARPGQSLSIPEAKPFSPYMGRGAAASLQVPNQDPTPLQCGPKPTLADKLAALNLPGLVENLGLQGQLTREPQQGTYAPSRPMTEEQAVGAEAIAARNARIADGERKNAELIQKLKAMGILDSARLVEENSFD